MSLYDLSLSKNFIISPVLFSEGIMKLSRATAFLTRLHFRSAKTQSSLRIHPVWSESSLSAWGELGSLATHSAHSEYLSDYLSLRLAQMPFCRFCHALAQMSQLFIDLCLDASNSVFLTSLLKLKIQSQRSVYSNDDPWLTLAYLEQGQFRSL